MEGFIKRLREISVVEAFYIRLEITISQSCSTKGLRGHIYQIIKERPRNLSGSCPL